MKEEIYDAVLTGKLNSANIDKTLSYLKNTTKAVVEYSRNKKDEYDVLAIKGNFNQIVHVLSLCAEEDIFLYEPKGGIRLEKSIIRIKHFMKEAKDKRMSNALEAGGLFPCYGKFGFRFNTPKTLISHQEEAIKQIRRCISCPNALNCANAKLIEQNEEVKGLLSNLLQDIRESRG